MDASSGEDLGHGVRVIPGSAEELVVLSPHLDLGWRVAAGRTPGTAVLWSGRAFEVVARSAVGSGSRWSLRPWPDAMAMRVVLNLDGDAVALVAEHAAAARDRRRRRRWSLPLLPLLGLAPARTQQRWSESWGFEAETATLFSAVVEIVLGGLGLVQALTLAFGGGWFLPPWMHWTIYVGPPLCVEGMVRLILAGALQGPVGSLFGLPLLLLEPGSAAAAPVPKPLVRLLNQERGELEIVTPEYRPDWHREAVLPFRGQAYRLDRADREGGTWVYRFARCREAVPGREEQLRLLPAPPAAAPVGTAPAGAPSIVGTALITAAVTLGPRADQERWADHLRLRPLWLTVAGAGAELAGGLVNLGRGAETGAGLYVIIDVFLVGEGLVRLGSAALGRPLGSVFGALLRPLYRRYLPGPGSDATAKG